MLAPEQLERLRRVTTLGSFVKTLYTELYTNIWIAGTLFNERIPKHVCGKTNTCVWLKQLKYISHVKNKNTGSRALGLYMATSNE